MGRLASPSSSSRATLLLAGAPADEEEPAGGLGPTSVVLCTVESSRSLCLCIGVCTSGCAVSVWVCTDYGVVVVLVQHA
jgi:hypothetical protein